MMVGIGSLERITSDLVCALPKRALALPLIPWYPETIQVLRMQQGWWGRQAMFVHPAYRWSQNNLYLNVHVLEPPSMTHYLSNFDLEKSCECIFGDLC